MRPVTEILDGLPLDHYGVVYADPPWFFKTYSDKGRQKAADNHYQCSGLDDIKAIPVQSVAAKNSVLLLWSTVPMLPQALEVMGAWGFTYKTHLVWVKLTKGGRPAFGTGHLFRNSTETLLLGTRGKPKILNHSTRNVLLSPRREHSRKPDEVYPMIESLYAGPYLEMFARAKRTGWSAVGNEVNKFEPTNAPLFEIPHERHAAE